MRSGLSEASASLRGTRNPSTPRPERARWGEHPRRDERSGARGLVRRQAQGPSALTGLIGWCGKGVTTLTSGAGFAYGCGRLRQAPQPSLDCVRHDGVETRPISRVTHQSGFAGQPPHPPSPCHCLLRLENESGLRKQRDGAQQGCGEGPLPAPGRRRIVVEVRWSPFRDFRSVGSVKG